MKFDDFKAMTPYQQEMLLVLERIAKSLESLAKTDEA